MYKKKLIIFDLDGVLIDSKANMELSWNLVNKKFNLKIPFSRYFKHIGKPFRIILLNLGIKNELNEIKKQYIKNSIKYSKKIKLYKGIRDVLYFLKKKKIKTAIVTSKERKRTIKLLNFFKIKVNYTECPNRILRGKPCPDHIIKIIKKFKINKKYCAYIGDTIFDKTAAEKSKIDFVLADYGYKIGIRNYKNMIKHPSEICKLI